MDFSDINQITCGVLFVKNYEIMDSWGKIADSVLYKSGNYFSCEYFPKISSQFTLSGSLLNDEMRHSFQITPENMIYTHSIQHSKPIDEELELFKDRVCGFLIPSVVERNKLSIRRIGIVLNCNTTKETYEKQLSCYLNSNEVFSSVKFSKKAPTRAGAKWTDKNDYINKIYSFGITDDEKYVLSFDYQMHFLPNREYISDISKSFFSNCFDVFKKEFLGEKSEKK